MTVRITHAKVSGKPAGTDATRVYGTHWDADHTLTGVGTLSKDQDTNITLALTGTPTGALLEDVTITAGWAGTLSTTRMSTNVVAAVTNDTNVTGSIASQNLTLGWTGTLSTTRLAQGTNGQLIVGQTGAAPAYKSVTGEVTITSSGVTTLDKSISPTWTGTHTFSNVPVFSAGLGSAVRETLTANRTYYVRTDGSDSNNGLANTAGGAFLTIQKAVDTVWDEIDQNGYAVTIQVGAGTYTGYVQRYGSAVGGIPTILGDTATPSNVHVSCTAPPAACFDFRRGAKVYLKGFKVSSATSGRGIHSSSCSFIEINDNFEFGACVDGHFSAEHGAVAGITASAYTVSGDAAWHWRAIANGHLSIAAPAVTLGSTPAFSTAFAVSMWDSSLQTSATFSGNATGPSYLAQDGTIVNSGGTFPGNSAGLIRGAGNYNSIIAAPRLYAISSGVDFNSANTDTAIPIYLPTGRTRYLITGVRIFGASASISTATFGVFSATGGGGTAVVTGGTAITVTATANNTNNNTMSVNANNPTTEVYDASTLYFRVGTAQGSAATASVVIEYIPLP